MADKLSVYDTNTLSILFAGVACVYGHVVVRCGDEKERTREEGNHETTIGSKSYVPQRTRTPPHMPGIQAGTPMDRSVCSPTRAVNGYTLCQRPSTDKRERDPHPAPENRPETSSKTDNTLCSTIGKANRRRWSHYLRKKVGTPITRSRRTYCSLGGWLLPCRQTCCHNTEQRCAFF